MKFRIDLAKLREGDQILALDHAPKFFELDDEDWSFDGRVTGEVTFHLQGHEIFARGTLFAHARGVCGRCLDPVEIIVKAPFDYIYQPGEEEPTDDVGVENVTEGLPEVAYYAGEVFDAFDELRESILLALPMIPVRTADDRCVHCGRDLSQPPHREPWPEDETQEPEWKRRLKGLGE